MSLELFQSHHITSKKYLHSYVGHVNFFHVINFDWSGAGHLNNYSLSIWFVLVSQRRAQFRKILANI